MKVRVEIKNSAHTHRRILEMNFLPRVGEFLETGSDGSCEVIQVLHTPESKEQAAVLVLQSQS